MKHKTKNTALILLGILFSVMLSAAGIFAFFLPKALSVAHGDSANWAESNFVVTEYENMTPAEYSFTRLNESDCSVRLENKATATKAVIPSKAEIDGVEYNVTEIADDELYPITMPSKDSLKIYSGLVGNTEASNRAPYNISVSYIKKY